jgi:hypothetical protein
MTISLTARIALAGALCAGFGLATAGRSPVGLVSGATYDNGRCMLVALDDQLVGTGWSLL